MSTPDEDLAAIKRLPPIVWAGGALFAMWGGLAFGVRVIVQELPGVSGWGWASVGGLAVVFALLTALIVRGLIARQAAPTDNGETRLARPDDLRAITGASLPHLDGEILRASIGHLPSGRRYVACAVEAAGDPRRHIVLGLNGSPHDFSADTTRLGWRLGEGLDAEVARRVMALNPRLFQRLRVVDGWLDLVLETTDEIVAARTLRVQSEPLEALAAAIEAGPTAAAYSVYETRERR